jgi:hypothetical protein
MKPVRLSPTNALAVLTAITLIHAPADLAAQRQRGPDQGSTRTGQAVPRQGGGERSRPAPRPDSGSTQAAGGDDRSVSADAGDEAAAQNPPPAARPRDTRPVGRAVPRSSVPFARANRVVIPRGFYRGYYPLAYGGLGFGYWGGSYGGFYDPFWYGGPGYYPSGYPAYGGYEGSLRLKVRPRDASVFVDGYFVGRVDEFDGVFQRLHVEPGPHRIEVRADGFQPLAFEVRILPGRTVTYEGELRTLEDEEP